MYSLVPNRISPCGISNTILKYSSSLCFQQNPFFFSYHYSSFLNVLFSLCARLIYHVIFLLSILDHGQISKVLI